VVSSRAGNAQAAQGALDAAARVAFSDLPSLIEALTQLTQRYRFQTPATMAEAIDFLAGVTQSNSILSPYDLSVFTEAANLSLAMTSGWKGDLKSLAVRWFSPTYRNAYRRAQSIRTAGRVTGKQVLQELNEAITVREFWNKWSAPEAQPVRIDEAHALNKLCHRAEAGLNEIEVTCKLRWRELPIPGLLGLVQALARDTATPSRVSRTCEIERDLHALGAQRLMTRFAAYEDRPANGCSCSITCGSHQLLIWPRSLILGSVPSWGRRTTATLMNSRISIQNAK
jgi:hypothetical protein